jgi:hypothetical protein
MRRAQGYCKAGQVSTDMHPQKQCCIMHWYHTASSGQKLLNSGLDDAVTGVSGMHITSLCTLLELMLCHVKHGYNLQPIVCWAGLGWGNAVLGRCCYLCR